MLVYEDLKDQAYTEIKRLKEEHVHEKKELEKKYLSLKELTEKNLKADAKIKKKETTNSLRRKIKQKNKGSRGVGIFQSNGSADSRIVYRGVFGGEYFKSGNSKAYLTDEQKLHQVEYFSD